MKKLGAKNPTDVMDDDTMRNIVEFLFPTHEIRPDPIEEDNIQHRNCKPLLIALEITRPRVLMGYQQR